MPAKLDIPLVYTVDPKRPEVLKRDLERLSSGVYNYSQDAAKRFAPIPSPAPNTQILAFGMTTRVALASGESLTLQLPQPDVKNGSLSLWVKRETSTGTCAIKAVGCLLNGRASKLLPAAPGVYQIFFDSVNYYSNPQLAADWS